MQVDGDQQKLTDKELQLMRTMLNSLDSSSEYILTKY